MIAHHFSRDHIRHPQTPLGNATDALCRISRSARSLSPSRARSDCPSLDNHFARMRFCRWSERSLIARGILQHLGNGFPVLRSRGGRRRPGRHAPKALVRQFTENCLCDGIHDRIGSLFVGRICGSVDPGS